jgi:hypothetical protein
VRGDVLRYRLRENGIARAPQSGHPRGVHGQRKRKKPPQTAAVTGLLVVAARQERQSRLRVESEADDRVREGATGVNGDDEVFRSERHGRQILRLALDPAAESWPT